MDKFILLIPKNENFDVEDTKNLSNITITRSEKDMLKKDGCKFYSVCDIGLQCFRDDFNDKEIISDKYWLIFMKVE